MSKYNIETDRFTHFLQSQNQNSLSSNVVYDIFEDNSKHIWLATTHGINKYNPKNKKFTNYIHSDNEPNSLSHNNVWSVIEDSEGYIWAATSRGINKLNPKNDTFQKYIYDANNPNSISANDVYDVYEASDNTIWAGTTQGLNKFNKEKNQFIHYGIKNGFADNMIYSILEDSRGNLWLTHNKGLTKFNPITLKVNNYAAYQGLQSNGSSFAKLKASDGKFYFGGGKGITWFYPDSITENYDVPQIAITGLKIINKQIFPGDTVNGRQVLTMPIDETKEIVFNYKDKIITFEFAAMHYAFTEKNNYKYKLENFDSEWNFIGNRRFATYTNLPPGEYVFKVIASNFDGIWNKTPTEIIITVEPPFWKTLWFKIILVLFIGGSFLAFYKIRMRSIKKQKAFLEEQVMERTHDLSEVNTQLEEKQADLETKQEEILAQKDLLEEQNNRIATQNDNIKGSIRYAKTIQEAILPLEGSINSIFESFVLFKPKDIVSGDFYWHTKIKDYFFLAVVDCTGHGVPGALMSLIGDRLLNEIINQDQIVEPEKILHNLNIRVIKILKQKQTSNTDGMDVCLCRFEKLESGLRVKFTGAKRPLFILRKSSNEIEEIKGTRKSIGGIRTLQNTRKFECNEFILQSKDLLYMTTDGFTDQNDYERKRFGAENLKKELKQISKKSMSEQKDLLDEKLKKFMINAEQRDDITVLGIKVS